MPSWRTPDRGPPTGHGTGGKEKHNKSEYVLPSVARDKSCSFPHSGVNLEPQWFGRRCLGVRLDRPGVEDVRCPLAVAVVAGTSEMPRTVRLPAVHNHVNVSCVSGDGGYGGGGGRRGCWAGFLHTAEDRWWNGSSNKWTSCSTMSCGCPMPAARPPEDRFLNGLKDWEAMPLDSELEQ